MDFHNPEFWLALAVGLCSLALLAYWLRTGGRSRD
jgi:cbb3-type cytochrome oxidase subunit 3